MGCNPTSGGAAETRSGGVEEGEDAETRRQGDKEWRGRWWVVDGQTLTGGTRTSGLIPARVAGLMKASANLMLSYRDHHWVLLHGPSRFEAQIDARMRRPEEWCGGASSPVRPASAHPVAWPPYSELRVADGRLIPRFRGKPTFASTSGLQS